MLLCLLLLFLQASVCSFTAGPAYAPAEWYWQLVVQRLHLTELQELHLAVCMQE